MYVCISFFFLFKNQLSFLSFFLFFIKKKKKKKKKHYKYKNKYKKNFLPINTNKQTKKKNQQQQQQLQIANIETDMCLDSAAKPDDMQGAVDPYKCHGQGGNQVLFISFFYVFFPLVCWVYD